MSKEEPESYLCRCCHSEGAFTSLFSYCWVDTEEILYMNVLQECFDIELAPVMQSMQHKLCSVCDSCAQRLQDAVHFKRQVHKCEMRFRDIYSSYIETQIINVKQEIEDVKDVLALSYGTRELLTQQAPMPLAYGTREVLEQPGPMSLMQPAVKPQQPEVKPLKSDDDDDDGFNDPDDDSDFKPTDDEKDVKKEKDDSDGGEKKVKRMKKEKPEGSVKKEPGKRKAKTPAKGKRKKATRTRVKKNPDSTDDEELDNIDGVSVIKVKITFRRNIDFKITEKGYECVRCPVILKTDNTMRRHILSAHFNAVKYKCPICLEGFKSFGLYIKHKLDKHNEDHRFKCNACDKAFFELQFLKDHTDTFHMMGEKRKCKVCEFETYSKVSFYKHKIKHLTVKNHQCKYCQKAFKRKTYLVLHERIHTGDKRKVCTECGEAYIDRTSLRYHMTRRHPEINF